MSNRPPASLALLQLCDSLFPIGAFAYSDGLETATAGGVVADTAGLAAWMEIGLDEAFGRYEGPAVLGAWTAFNAGAWEVLFALDADVAALRPSSASRRATRAMGQRLLTTWQAIRADASIEAAVAQWGTRVIPPTLPVAFGCVAAAAGIDARAALEGFAYSRLASTVSAAMRLMPIGQTDAHRLLTQTLARVPTVVDGTMARGQAPESFAPAMDIAAMMQPYLHSRLFRS